MYRYTDIEIYITQLLFISVPIHVCAENSGEVERILNMVDGVVLVVDATHGPGGKTDIYIYIYMYQYMSISKPLGNLILLSQYLNRYITIYICIDIILYYIILFF